MTTFATIIAPFIYITVLIIIINIFCVYMVCTALASAKPTKPYQICLCLRPFIIEIYNCKSKSYFQT